MKIDFFARREHFIDHLLPIWNEIPNNKKGIFYIHANTFKYTIGKIINICVLRDELEPNRLEVFVPGTNPIVTCAYGDMVNAYKSNPDRIFILAEHGVGLTFGDNAGYAGGLGMRRIADCFLAPNEYIANKTEKVLDTTQYIIGTPKLDEWGNPWIKAMNSVVEHISNNKPVPTVCISFHWDGSHVAPEAGNAFGIFGRDEVLKELKETFNLIGHCHPKSRDHYRPIFENLGIPFVENFSDVMAQADIYVNDASSTMYEFLVTGKPVILMNAPHFRKDIHFGIRFWDYTDIGYQVKTPRELKEAIQNTIIDPNKFLKQRQKAVKDLYPYLGNSAKVAANAILHFIEVKKNMQDKLLHTENYDKLKTLLSGFNNSTKGISNIEIQHLAWLGSQIPDHTCVLEIGSHRGKSACCIASGIKYSGRTNPINCIDIWQEGKGSTFDHYYSEETWEIFKRQIKDMGFEDIVVPHKSESYSASRTYKKALAELKTLPIGLLFIDANHHEPFVENDYNYWHEFVVCGGWIAFHDYGTRFPAVDRVVDTILKPSNLWTDYTIIGRIFTARKK